MVFTINEFNTAFSKDIKETFHNQSMEAEMNSTYAKLYDVSDTNEYTASYTSTEGVDLPSYFDEGETLGDTKLGKGYKTTYSSREFGKFIGITKQARLKLGDNSEKIAVYAEKQKKSMLVAMKSFLEKEMAGLMDYANASSASYKILSPDLLPIASAAHVWNSTGATFDNDLGTDAIDIGHAADVETYAGAFTDSQGTAMPLNFNKIFVKKGGAASKQAKAVYASKNAQGQYQVTDLGDMNIYSGMVQVIETPWMASGNDYLYVASTDELGVENPLFCEFIERPTVGDTFTENKNLTWETPVTASFKFGLKNLPFNLLYGKVA